MVITLTGSNFYLIKRRLDELSDDFVAKNGELALQHIDAEDATSNAVLDAVQSLPFLASRKMVILRNLSANKSLNGQIEQIISSAGDTTDIIFYEANPDKRASFFKVLKSKTQLEEYDELDVQGLCKWLVDQAKKLGGQISPADAKYLVDRVGSNQQQLANELEKLVIYNPKISKENIDLLTVKNPQSKIFDLLDAAFLGRKGKALELYDEQRAQKVEPQAIMAMMAWQLKLLALTKYAGSRSPQQIAKDAGVSPYPVMKAQNLSNKISQQKLKQMVAEALDIDIKSKTVGLDLDEALKTYIVTL